jgi:hypothetical protein
VADALPHAEGPLPAAPSPASRREGENFGHVAPGIGP